MERGRRTCTRANLLTAACSMIAASCLVQQIFGLEPVGWRGDGTGQFKSTRSPTVWSQEKGISWRIDLPATSLASPVVLRDKVFVMAEPNRLLCYRLSDGKLLWDRPHEYEAIFGQEKANEIKDQHAQAQKARAEIAELEKQLKPEAKPGSPQAPASEIQERIKLLRQREEELTTIPPAQVDATGNTASTPVCDHENVYVVLGNGIVSSHSLDGQLKWIHFIGKPMPRHSASPVIVGSLLIVHLQQLVALDTSSGKIVWKADTPPRNGTPVVLKAGENTFIVTPGGAIVRSNDGKLLAKGLFDLPYCSPTVHERVVYAAERGRLLAIEISATEDSEPFQTKVLWEVRSAQEDRLASPVVHDGLLFSATGSGILDVVDIPTGRIIKRMRLELGDGRVDASLSLANGLLYVQNTGGKTLILKPDRDCTEVASNVADGSSSSPYFVGKRLLLRTPTRLVCLGDE